MTEICSAFEFIEKHPEIKTVRLIWTWPFDAEVCADDGGVMQEFTGDDVDEEYSFIGTREECLGFLLSYSCWDGHEWEWEDHIVDGHLDFEYCDYTYGNNHHDEIPETACFVCEVIYIGPNSWDIETKVIRDISPDEFARHGWRS